KPFETHMRAYFQELIARAKARSPSPFPSSTPLAPSSLPASSHPPSHPPGNPYSSEVHSHPPSVPPAPSTLESRPTQYSSSTRTSVPAWDHSTHFLATSHRSHDNKPKL